MNNLTALINKIKEMEAVGSIGYSDYKELMMLARELQVEGGK